MRAWPMARARAAPIAVVLIVAAVWALADAGDQAATSVWAAGPLDETAHLLTALLVVWAAGGALDAIAPWVLIASVAIDLDHLPGDFGAQWLTAGDPRPYPHSLLTVLVVALAGWAWPRRRRVCVGVCVGLLIHFWRDLSEPGTGVGLLWPATSTPFALAHSDYVVGMAVLVALALRHAAAGRLWPRSAAVAVSASASARTSPRPPGADQERELRATVSHGNG